MTSARRVRLTRSFGVLTGAVLLLAGCALVDDARREAGSDPDRRAGPRAGSTAPRPPATSPPPAGPYRSGEPGGAPDGSGGPQGCPSSGVLVRPGTSDAAMGLRVMGIELVNCGTVPYTVNGYPGVRLLDENWAPLPVAVIHGSAGVAVLDNFDTPPAPVTAAPGERLSFGLVWRNTVADTTIDPVNAIYLEVVPAPGQVPQTVRPEGRLDLGTTGRLGITAWRRASR
jgi:hypothetical protein